MSFDGADDLIMMSLFSRGFWAFLFLVLAVFLIIASIQDKKECESTRKCPVEMTLKFTKAGECICVLEAEAK